jgi:hypothetical protein
VHGEGIDTVNPAIGAQLTASAVFVFLLQWLKNSRWFPWISQETYKLNRVLAIAAAGLSAVGVNYQVVHPGPGDWTIAITGLTAAGISAAGVMWLKQFCVQELTYRMAVKAVNSNGNGKTNGVAPVAFKANPNPAPGTPGSNTKS